MSWVIYLKILSTENFVLLELWTLLYISAYFWDAFWLLYPLIIIVCSEVDIRSNIFSAIFFPSVFVFFSVERSNNISLRSDGYGSGVRMVRLHVRTHLACHMLIWQHASGRVSDPSGRGPYRLYLDAHTLAVALPPTPLGFLFFFVLLSAFFSQVLHYLGLFCPLMHISLHFRYFFNSLYSFQCFANC
jgi:hypothetical protein